MKFLKVFFALSLGYLSLAHAKQEDITKQYVQPITVKLFSNNKGVVQQEHFSCMPDTCCFSEKFYCFMESGKCICDLFVCARWPKSADVKSFWMELTGAEAEKFCGRPRPLHELTNLCLCDPNRDPPCDECNRPTSGYPSSRAGLSCPPDCRPL